MRILAAALALVVCVGLGAGCEGGPIGGAPAGARAGQVAAEVWAAPPAQPVAMRLAVPSEWPASGPVPLTLLEPFEIELLLYTAEGASTAFEPAVPPGFAGDVSGPEQSVLGSGRVRRWHLTLRPIQLGETVLPAFVATATGADGAAHTAESSVRELVVAGRLAEDDAGAMEDSGLLPAPPRLWPWFAGAGAVVALLAAVWWWRRRPRKAMRDGVDVPAHVRAQRALSALRTAPRSTRAEVEQFYVAVSQVLRDYIEARFGVAAPERTTEEFLQECDGHPALGGDSRDALGRFLTQCDLVKFAGHQPAAGVHEQVLDQAVAFVDATRPELVPGLAPGGAPDGGAGAGNRSTPRKTSGVEA